jgi:dolichol-phosphate mannosyltransferase
MTIPSVPAVALDEFDRHGAAYTPALALVIPTLREAGNIRTLLERVRTALDRRNPAYEVIVVDDDSRDGTEAIVAAMGEEDPRIRLVVRTGERGLAGAVIRGWEESTAPVLAVMDADLQHPPELLPELWAALDAGADLAVGSRYATGGDLDGWKASRALISKIAIWMTLPVQRASVRAHDPMSGFFFLRRACIDGMELRRTGFKILLEILARGQVETLVEIPFAFGRRHDGSSKASLRVAWDYFALLWKLFREKRKPTSPVPIRTIRPARSRIAS